MRVVLDLSIDTLDLLLHRDDLLRALMQLDRVRSLVHDTENVSVRTHTYTHQS